MVELETTQPMEALPITVLLEVVGPQPGAVLLERRMELITALARLGILRQALTLSLQGQGHQLMELDLPHTATHSLREHRLGADQVRRACLHLHLVEHTMLPLRQHRTTLTPHQHPLRVQIARLWMMKIHIRLRLGLLQLQRPMLSMLLHLLRQTIYRDLQSPQIQSHWREIDLMPRHLELVL